MRRCCVAGAMAVLLLTVWRGAAGPLVLAPLFQDNMVLQRDVAAPVWGVADPGVEVAVTLAGQTVSTRAAADGKWQVKVGPLKVGAPLTLTVVAGTNRVERKQVLAGDVWLCSGQSNMQMTLNGVNDAANEMASADFPSIRVFTVTRATGFEPAASVGGAWQVCTPQTAGAFTAVGYFFGRYLHRELNVPVGLIDSSWGGTVAEAWVSREALAALPDYTNALVQAAAAEADWQARGGLAGFDERVRQWWQTADPLGAQQPAPSAVAFDDSALQSLEQPGAWEIKALTNFDGVVWLRRSFDVPAGLAGQAGTIELGPVGQQDVTYVNGRQVGAMTDGRKVRSYRIGAGLLKAGANTVAVRVYDMGAPGGLYGKPDQLRLVIGGRTNSLAGAWKYAAQAASARLPEKIDGVPNRVGVLYNGMIAPLLPYAIKGAIWYQGESNTARAAIYQRQLAALIADWRARFGCGEFPFGIVQLANFKSAQTVPGEESSWAALRDAQSDTAQKVTNAGLAVIIDIGDGANIHPRNKQDVGKRLALWALNKVYGREVVYSGPVFKSMTVRDGQAVLSFEHLGGGLMAKDNKPTGFVIAGADKQFVWAQAEIVGDTVVLSAPAVQKPAVVRYAWADNPPAGLFNQAGLPAVPFRTDRPSGQ